MQIVNDGSDQQKQTAEASVGEEYKKVRQSFLWIKNVWVADAPNKKAIPSFEEYSKIAKLSELDLSEDEADNYKVQYEAVMGSLRRSEGVNGYFILAILAGLTAFLYQYLITKETNNKQKNEKKSAGQEMPQGQGKTMMIALPLIMLIFTLNYNSVFAIYIVTTQLFGMATAPLINKFVNKKQ